MVYKKTLGILIILSLSLLFTACPSDDIPDCIPIGGDVIVNDLVILTPLQSTYQRGDIINVKLTIPAQSNYFAGRNIFIQTNVLFGIFTFEEIRNEGLIQGNILNLVSGVPSGISGKYNFPYNLNTTNYEFEANITLNRLGNYKVFSSKNSHIVTFNEANECNKFIIRTNKAGGNASGNIEFVVQ